MEKTKKEISPSSAFWKKHCRKVPILPKIEEQIAQKVFYNTEIINDSEADSDELARIKAEEQKIKDGEEARKKAEAEAEAKKKAAAEQKP